MKKKRCIIVVNPTIDVDPTPVNVNPTIDVDPTPVNVNPTINVDDSTLTVGPFQRVCNSTVSSTAVFSNPETITIPGAGESNPYPSTIGVTGMTGAIAKVTVTLFNLSHAFPDDIDILLVHPNGTTNTILMSDAGGSSNITNVTLTFDDSAASFIPDSGPVVSGTFKPTNYEAIENLPAPAPPSSPFVGLSNFIGLAPNGPWRLFVFDDFGGSSGEIADGWSLTITTDNEVCTFTPL
ncbi:proprotein convertase P-domain-containing protein [Paenibacillus sp. PL91]|uniref:proprotein convertase P-domain-containing protein n=1 Tax=Paenibacillus sp. PL91 TaxID=2729538 RepID=UPI00145CA7BF|nr:proprotein convertase P-domain-containing protein [Paenibacillus sp. PL91]MBC9204663.1 hypothetical protein [Paenibacillus sp. PL91]